MDIKPAAPATPQTVPPLTADPAALARLYAPGRILTGIIEAVSQQAQNQRPEALFQILINAEGRQIKAQSNQSFSVGQQLKLEVMPDASLRVLQIRLPATTAQQNILQQGLRQTLPIQQSPTVLLNRLGPIQQLLSSLNLQLGNSTIDRLQQQIEALLTTLPRRQQLQNPTQLKRAITDNGALLEPKLQRILQQLINAAADGKTQPISAPGKQSTNPAPTAADEKPLNAALRKNAHLIKQFEGLISKDLKAQLLKLAADLAPLAKPATATPGLPADPQLLGRILQAVYGTTQTAAGHPTDTAHRQPFADLPQIALTPQLQLALRQAGVALPDNQTRLPREAFDLAVSTLLRQIAASIAKIQTHQLSGLTTHQAVGTDSPLINSWHAEIPVFHDGQFRPIQIQIDEERGKDQTGEGRQGRQWKITLGFDFEELGEFFATLNIVEGSISTTFWSEHPQTLERISNELEILQNSLTSKGLQVTQLECRRGKPPLRETRLEQQLVDIKT